jgi:hypothetical protein
VPFSSDCTVTFSVDGVAWLSGVYFTVADDPTANLVPGAAGPEADAVFGALVDAGVDAGVAAGVDVAGAAACELDEELLPQAAKPAARPAVARTMPAPLLNPNQPT